MRLRKRLLWIDGIAGLSAGVVVLAASPWLSRWYGLPHGLLLFLGSVNMAYGSLSLPLAMRSVRQGRLIEILAVANIVWATVCWSLAAHFRVATALGVAHLVGEGLFVFVLGVLEWRWREALVVA